MISTGSYAGWRKGDPAPVRISLGKPRWTPPGRKTWLYVAELAPRGWYLRRDRERFTAAYLSQIDRLADEIERKLGWLTDQYGPIVLCCWERRPDRPSEWCHRTLAAAFLEATFGLQVSELRRTP